MPKHSSSVQSSCRKTRELRTGPVTKPTWFHSIISHEPQTASYTKIQGLLQSSIHSGGARPRSSSIGRVGQNSDTVRADTLKSYSIFVFFHTIFERWTPPTVASKTGTRSSGLRISKWNLCIWKTLFETSKSILFFFSFLRELWSSALEMLKSEIWSLSTTRPNSVKKEEYRFGVVQQCLSNTCSSFSSKLVKPSGAWLINCYISSSAGPALYEENLLGIIPPNN